MGWDGQLVQVFPAMVGVVCNASDGAGIVSADWLRDADDDRCADGRIVCHHRGICSGRFHYLSGEHPSVVDLGILDIAPHVCAKRHSCQRVSGRQMEQGMSHSLL